MAKRRGLAEVIEARAALLLGPVVRAEIPQALVRAHPADVGPLPPWHGWLHAEPGKVLARRYVTVTRDARGGPVTADL